jgi:hypothetical protein
MQNKTSEDLVVQIEEALQELLKRAAIKSVQPVAKVPGTITSADILKAVVDEDGNRYVEFERYLRLVRAVGNVTHGNATLEYQAIRGGIAAARRAVESEGRSPAMFATMAEHHAHNAVISTAIAAIAAIDVDMVYETHIESERNVG